MNTVIINNKNLWRDWRILCVGHSTTTKSVYTAGKSVDSVDGVLDDTETVAGKVTYGLRVITLNLRAIPKLTHEKWMDTYYKLIDEIHGQKVNCTINGMSYSGRAEIKECRVKDDVSDITIEIEG